MHNLSLCVDTGLAVLIWIVQAVVYPSFRHIDPRAFSNWHATYTQRMGYIAAPLMIAQLAIACVHAYQNLDLVALTYLFLVSLTWLTTFLFSVPFHQKLQKTGPEPETLTRLVSTNWIRTILWSLIALLNIELP